jgi:capsular polysaccharide biosynthesis protein
MQWLFAPPAPDDVIRLLRAWRFWLLATLAGGLIGAAVHAAAPPPYRARATVVVDFNLEEAWPKDTDRQQFYYLERETRKLEEIAWSDAVMQAVSAASRGPSVNLLRDGKLRLSQPAEGGWHFYADDRDPAKAAELASAWAQAFATQVELRVAAQTGLSSFIQVEVTQAADLPTSPRVDPGTYVLAGSAACLAVSAVVILFMHEGKPESIARGNKNSRRRAKRK